MLLSKIALQGCAQRGNLEAIFNQVAGEMNLPSVLLAKLIKLPQGRKCAKQQMFDIHHLHVGCTGKYDKDTV